MSHSLSQPSLRIKDTPLDNHSVNYQKKVSPLNKKSLGAHRDFSICSKTISPYIISIYTIATINTIPQIYCLKSSLIEPIEPSTPDASYGT